MSEIPAEAVEAVMRAVGALIAAAPLIRQDERRATADEIGAEIKALRMLGDGLGATDGFLLALDRAEDIARRHGGGGGGGGQ
jgi:hypothetical protein